MSQHTQYLEFAKQLASEAGDIMRKYFMSDSTQWKRDSTPVTAADTEINSMVISKVTQVYPDHSVLGEEESINLGERFTWVCDPVDGTMPYAHHLPISVFSIALCDDGVPIVGVVYDPFMDRMFYATKGGGAFCNDQPIAVSSQGIDKGVMDIEGMTSISKARFIEFHGQELHEGLINRGAKIVRLWSVVLPTCLIASGQFTAAMFKGDTPHDVAASKVIVEEAGGRVTDLFGNEQRYDQPIKGMIASNGVVHDELVELVGSTSHEI